MERYTQENEALPIDLIRKLEDARQRHHKDVLNCGLAFTAWQCLRKEIRPYYNFDNFKLVNDLRINQFLSYLIFYPHLDRKVAGQQELIITGGVSPSSIQPSHEIAGNLVYYHVVRPEHYKPYASRLLEMADEEHTINYEIKKVMQEARLHDEPTNPAL